MKQESHFCGPASIASVMDFYGVSIDQRVIGERIYSKKLKGSLITDLENFARDYGFQTKLSQGKPDDIKSFIDQKKPVIVLVELGFWRFSRPHYLVVYGYNDKGFVAHSGLKPAEQYKFSRFQKIWNKKGAVYLLIYSE